MKKIFKVVHIMFLEICRKIDYLSLFIIPCGKTFSNNILFFINAEVANPGKFIFCSIMFQNSSFDYIRFPIFFPLNIILLTVCDWKRVWFTKIITFVRKKTYTYV